MPNPNDRLNLTNKIRWYVNRARNMELKEIPHRVRERARSAATDFQLPIEESALVVNASTDPGSPLRIISQDTVAFEGLVDQILSGSVEVLGATWSTKELLWDVDPVTQYVWPKTRSSRIDYRHESGADPKWSWEVNRLLFLLPLAEAVRCGYRQSECSEALNISLMSWLEVNRMGHGIAWSASIEVAIRLVVFSLIASGPKSAVSSVSTLLAPAVASHASWIERFPSLYSSANNHRVAEISALLAADGSWHGLLERDRRTALENELLETCRRLFAADGIGAEQSPTYAGFTIELAALALRMSEWNSDGVARSLRRILRRGVQTLCQFTKPGGVLMRYGDDDEGKILTWSVEEESYVKTLAGLCGIPQEELQRTAGSMVFADGGHTILRHPSFGTETTVMFDHAALGFGSIAAHGHADALSFQLHTGDQEWVVDPGTFRYHGDKAARDYFRSSAAHNAPTYSALDSSQMLGDFNWSKHKRAIAVLKSYCDERGRTSVSASHDGYVKLGYGRVARTVSRVGEGAYSVDDEFVDVPGEMVTTFMFHPDCKLTQVEELVWAVARGGSDLRLSVRFPSLVDVQTQPPFDHPAWYSPRFGWREQAPTLTSICALQNGEQAHYEFTFENVSTKSIGRQQ